MIDARHPLYLLALASLSLPGKPPPGDGQTAPAAVAAPPRQPDPAPAGTAAGGRG